MRSIVRALEARPSLGEGIRRLRINRTPFTFMTGRSDVERALAIFKHATGLTDLKVVSRLRYNNEETPADVQESLRLALLAFATTIKRFVLEPSLAETIEDVQRQQAGKLIIPAPLAQSMAAWENLSVLSLWQVSFAGVCTTVRPTFRLARLSMDQVVLPGPQLTWLLSSSASGGLLSDVEVRLPLSSVVLLAMTLAQLTGLTGGDCVEAAHAFRDALLAFLAEAGPALCRLAFHTNLEELFANPASTATFGKLTRLQYFTITSADFSPDQLGAVLRASPRLQQLSLAACTGIEPILLVQLLRTPLPSLKRVRIEPSSHAFLSSEEQERVRSSEARIWPLTREERRRMRGICSLHSIALVLEGSEEPLDVELSSADEIEPTSMAAGLGGGAETDEGEDEDPDGLFVFDDDRRAWWEEERARDLAMLERAKQEEEASSSQDEFLAATSEEDV